MINIVHIQNNEVLWGGGKELESELGVQQCFGVVYHELTTLRRVYFGFDLFCTAISHK